MFGLIGIIVYFVKQNGNTKVRNEGLAYTNQVPIGTLNTGDTFKFQTLVPLGQQPEIRLTFKDIKTSEIFSISK